jgi:hypothetical protein
MKRKRLPKLHKASRSKVGNGTALLLPGIDGRSVEYRRFKDIRYDIIDALGGEEYVRPQQDQIIRRAAGLGMLCELMECDIIDGKRVDVDALNKCANSQRRLLVSLGLERKARDVTPDLAAYLQTD